MPRTTTLPNNLAAFLDMIAFSEGTSSHGDDGYNVLVGSTPRHPLLFDSYSRHPGILNEKHNSTAAGRYQLLKRYFADYAKMLLLPDFSPENQDKIAIQQIKERKALDDIAVGNIEKAIGKCKNIWASLPGAGYGQHEHQLDHLLAAYSKFGGKIA